MPHHRFRPAALHRVRGASGWICPDDGGNTFDTGGPSVRYRTNGPPVFVNLAWPTGSPPVEMCTAPSGLRR